MKWIKLQNSLNKDKKDVKEDVTEFMQDYTTVHYAFDEGCEGYDYIEF